MRKYLQRLGVRLDTAGAPARMRRVKCGWPASASPGVAFHNTCKVQFRYREAGAGPCIVFTADPPMTLENYNELVAAFSAQFRVIVVELPAMGFSVASEDFAFGFRETNDEIAQFVSEVAGEGAILAFSCVAGLAGIDVATRFPDLCSHLVLIQTGDVRSFELWKAGRDPKGVLATPILGQLAMKRLALKRMPAWYRLSVGKQELIDGLCTCAARSFSHGAQWSLASAYQCYMNANIALTAPVQPVLSIWGAGDRSHPSENMHAIRSLALNAQQVTFADLGHTPELEDPRRVLGAVLEFLAEFGQVRERATT